MGPAVPTRKTAADTPLVALAQSEGTPFDGMVERVTRFGERIPQEKVYVHMDNTSYFQGDTIWFKAYLRRTDTDKPSHVSNTLYVELRDPDGYLKERKQIWMTNGEGDGYFSLGDSSYCIGGYYELRAYTRWQLNWGATEHPHTPIAEQWFFNKAAARDYFRDYDKLYSRVFPIYSEYEEVDGEMYPVMWARPMQRQFKHDPKKGKPTLCIEVQKELYEPHEQVTLQVKGKPGGGNVSVSVRSNKSAAYLNDNGNILTEMLLASEIRGFVPQPGWYFESDDEEHRQALDLLMMTQGWRRFPWQDMALRGRFELVHPAERTPILTGAVHTYEAVMKFDPALVDEMYVRERFLGTDSMEALSIINERFGFNDLGGRRHHRGKDLKKNERADSIGATKELRKRLMADGEKLRHEVKVHADFFHPRGAAAKSSWEGASMSPTGSLMAQASYDARDWEAVWGESVTKDGTFRMQLPVIDEYCFLTLAASDTTKWSKAEKKGKRKHQWYWHDETSYPEFYVRLAFPYPQFVKPYSYYQVMQANAPSLARKSKDMLMGDSLQTTRMKEVKVTGKRRNRLQSVTETTPVLKLDAMQAYNMVVDAGLLNGWMSSAEQFGMALARYLVSDMGQNRQYDVRIFYDDDLGNPNGNFSIMGRNPDAVIKKAGLLSMLDSLYIYTDYAPRKEGDRRYRASNQPEVGVSVTLRSTPRPVSVDRYMRLPGFARAAEFYSPDYSKRTPSQDESDYRRTLYWNPYVRLDSKGEASITLYNNSLNAGIIVSAQGQSPSGALLWNKSEE